jgi:hypothetical protein
MHNTAGQVIDSAAAAALAADVVAAAQARGRSLDWWDTAVRLVNELALLKKET